MALNVTVAQLCRSTKGEKHEVQHIFHCSCKEGKFHACSESDTLRNR
jgi:hypothetical protein